MPFINIHTHTTAASSGIAIVNVLQDFKSIKSDGWYSAGIHPWYVKENMDDEISALKKALTLTNVIVIGECGLDKICATNFELQKKIFSIQIAWANEFQKPMIIHCVKAYDEVLLQLKNEKVNVPVIFHGYNKSKELATSILKEGYFLSFGKDLFREEVKIVFAEVPIEKIYLETDNSAFSIQEIYQKAAAIKHLSLETLMEKMNGNYLKLLATSNLISPFN